MQKKTMKNIIATVGNPTGDLSLYLKKIKLNIYIHYVIICPACGDGRNNPPRAIMHAMVGA
jgi:hypothetical protein